MKPFCAAFLALLFFLLPMAPAYAETAAADLTSREAEANAPSAQDVAGELDFSAVENYLKEIQDDTANMLGAADWQELLQQAKSGELSLHPADLGKTLGQFFLGEIFANGKILAQLAILAAACLILTNLRSAMASDTVANLSHGVVYLVLLSIALQSFGIAGAAAKEAVEHMSGFLYALSPLLMTLLAAMGGLTSINIVHPLLLFLVGTAVNIIQIIVLPLVYFSAILGIVGYISPRFNVSKLAKLCRDIAIGIMTLMLTLFIAALGLAGLTGGVMDGLTVKAAKTATGLFIPVVGKSLADAMDTVLGTSLVLKNTIGIFGVVVIFLICAVPAIKVLVMSLMYRLTAALVEPLGDGQLAEALNGLGNSLLALFAVVAACGLLFFFVLSIVVGMGNVSMMMR